MRKAFDTLSHVAVAALFAVIAHTAGSLSVRFMEVPAPITPLLWVCCGFFGLFAVGHAVIALAIPFRKEH